MEERRSVTFKETQDGEYDKSGVFLEWGIDNFEHYVDDCIALAYMSHTAAIIEMADGSVELVRPSYMKFVK